jgi:hypothetical protein
MRSSRNLTLSSRELQIRPDPDPTGFGSKDFAFIGSGSGLGSKNLDFHGSGSGSRSGSGSNFKLGPDFDFASNPSIDKLKVKYKIFFPLFQDCFVLFNLIIKKVILNAQTKKERKTYNQPAVAEFITSRI